MLQELAQAVERLSGGDHKSWPVRQLGDNIAALRSLIDRQEAEFANWVARYDEEKGYRAEGATSTVSWLRSRCGLSGGAAAQRVEIARELNTLPGATDLFASGKLSFNNAAVLARTVTEIGKEAASIASEALVDAAKRLSPENLRTVGRQLRHAVDPDGALAQALRDHRRRRLSIDQLFDGMFVIDGLLDAEGGALLRTAVEAVSKPVKDDDRTAAQRRADALVELASQQLQSGDLATAGGIRPHLHITTSAEAIAGDHTQPAAELSGVGPIPAATLQRFACDASVTEIQTGRVGDPLSVGRATRSTPPSLRRALVRRDEGCAWPGCDRPPSWTESHHIRHWAQGGHTTLRNLVLLCRVHHRFVHEGGWKLTMPAGVVQAEPP